MKFNKAVKDVNGIFMSYEGNEGSVYYPFPVGCRWDDGLRADCSTVVNWGKYAMVATGTKMIPLSLAKQMLSKDNYRKVVRKWIANGGRISELQSIQRCVDFFN
jgi:hypothetical protein